MILCFDVGNTSVKVASFDEEKLIKKCVISLRNAESKEDYFSFLESANFGEPERIIYSSVATQVNELLLPAIEELYGFRPYIFNNETITDLVLDTDNPKEIGSDLLAELVFVKEKIGYPCIIADFGTASKFLVLDEKGAFISALIVPGMKSSAYSLFSSTALLPQINLRIPETIIAKNTEDCINAGIVYGHVEMAKGLTKRLEDELGYKCKKVLTGGRGLFVKDLLKDEFEFYEDLVLCGLNIVMQKNYWRKKPWKRNLKA